MYSGICFPKNVFYPLIYSSTNNNNVLYCYMDQPPYGLMYLLSKNS